MCRASLEPWGWRPSGCDLFSISTNRLPSYHPPASGGTSDPNAVSRQACLEIHVSCRWRSSGNMVPAAVLPTMTVMPSFLPCCPCPPPQPLFLPSFSMCICIETPIDFAAVACSYRTVSFICISWCINSRITANSTWCAWIVGLQ